MDSTLHEEKRFTVICITQIQVNQSADLMPDAEQIQRFVELEFGFMLTQVCGKGFVMIDQVIVESNQG